MQGQHLYTFMKALEEKHWFSVRVVGLSLKILAICSLLTNCHYVKFDVKFTCFLLICGGLDLTEWYWTSNYFFSTSVERLTMMFQINVFVSIAVDLSHITGISLWNWRISFGKWNICKSYKNTQINWLLVVVH